MKKALLEIFMFSEDIITASGGLVNGGDLEEGSGNVEIASLDDIDINS